MYVDLMGGVKPHLIKSIVNNLGATTLMTYAPSTKFYLADKAAGTPWLTRLSFPVHVVAQVDHLDAISNSHLTTTYTYHQRVVKDYEKAIANNVQGYSEEGGVLGFGTSERHTSKPLPKELKDYLDKYVLEGKVKTKLQDDPTLGRMIKDIEKSVAASPRGATPRDK
jgi:hypothetical protein